VSERFLAATKENKDITKAIEDVKVELNHELTNKQLRPYPAQIGVQIPIMV
tara:strand:- start:1136 stop:1288 length:153 start_codon:yes stop_codon:yes gene_type:complete